MKAAIVTTVRGGCNLLLTWTHYHIKIGFDHLFIYLDSPVEEDLQYAKIISEDEKVTVIHCDEYYKEEIKKLKTYPKLKAFTDNEVQARQQLNAEAALIRCQELGIDWLLHIDIDELFYCEKELQSHLQWLESKNVGIMTYKNYEAVPEQLDIDDPFIECTLFRKHLSSLKINTDTMKSLQFWKSRTNNGQYFIAYDIGKSIARVVDVCVPNGVHTWKFTEDCELSKNTAIPDPRNLNLEEILNCEEVLILHYVSCGFKWWHKKYHILSNFPDSWFGGSMKITPCFHLDSRDKYLGGDIELMKRFYKEQVVLDDEEEVNRQIKSETCIRIEKPSNYLKHLSQKPLTTQTNAEKSKEKILPSHPIKNEAPPNNLSLDKMWIISSLVSQYMKPDENKS